MLFNFFRRTADGYKLFDAIEFLNFADACFYASQLPGLVVVEVAQ